jgi:hypothetical protein
VSAKAVRDLGYIDIQETTAGTWASAPTYTQLMGPGIKKAGDIVQVLYASSTTATTGSATTNEPAVPSISITPTSAANLIKVTSVGNTNEASAAQLVAQMYRAAGASAACTTAVGSSINTGLPFTGTVPTTLEAVDAPNSTSQQTYAPCIKTGSSVNAIWCSQGTGTSACTIEALEIMS